MFNVTGGELLIILLVALIVLGPERLPGAVRSAGRLFGELRKMATGFQEEVRNAFEEPDGHHPAGPARRDADDPPVATDLRTAAELEAEGSEPEDRP